MKKENQIIVAFHIGRGGNFNNPGYLQYLGENTIGRYTDGLTLEYENYLKFKDRYGWDEILTLLTDNNLEDLEKYFGITEEMLGKRVYFDSNGNKIGLSEKEVEEGIGRIDEDGEYDTTYTRYIDDCTEEEISLILNSTDYKSAELRTWLNDYYNKIEADTK